MASLPVLTKPPRPATAPHGVPVSVQFFGHDPSCTDYKNAKKIKTIDIHPSYTWVITADEESNITLWDYYNEAILLSFPADSLKESQRNLVETLETHYDFAAQNNLAVPDLNGPGLGQGVAYNPGATSGSGTETFIAASIDTILANTSVTSASSSSSSTISSMVISSSSSANNSTVNSNGSSSNNNIVTSVGVVSSIRSKGLNGSGSNSNGAGPGGNISNLPEDAKSTKIGHIRGVKFADEHVLIWSTGNGRGDYNSTDIYGNLSTYTKGNTIPLASSIDDIDALLSGATNADYLTNPHSTPTTNPSTANQSSSPSRTSPPAWLIILCEYRVLLLDYQTRAVIDIPHNALLIEASGPSGLQRTLTKGKPSVYSAALIGPGMIAFGCEDGAIRIWSAEISAVIQVIRPQGNNGRSITHMSCISSAPHIAGTTSSVLSPSSSFGVLAKTADVRLVCGYSDGNIFVYEVMGGRMIVDNTRGGLQHIRLPAELVDLQIGPLTMTAVALAADKTIASWDLTANPIGPGVNNTGTPTVGSPRIAASKVVTSSTSAEGGVGSRLMAAVPMGSHPFLSPGTALVVGKGPHLELAIVGSSDRTGENGTIIYDLRTARSGLPTKLKVYTLGRHPWRPDTVAAGTNIGVFVFQIAPSYTTGAFSITHPAWTIPPTVTNELSPEGSRIKEGKVAIYVNAMGMLIAAECTVTTGATLEDVEQGIVSSSNLSNLNTANGLVRVPNKLPANQSAGIHIQSFEHILLPTFGPAMPPPSVLGGTIPGGPPPAHNALALLAPLLKGAMPTGPRGVRLRVSGSGRYISAVWPEHRCYAIYKLNMPIGLLVPPVNTTEDTETVASSSANEWGCEYVEGGTAIDVAWSSYSVGNYDDKYSLNAIDQSTTESNPSASSASSTLPLPSRYDRYVVLEPGMVVSGRGPMGGGMAIGSSAPSNASNTKKTSKKEKQETSNSNSSGKIAMTPTVMSLRHLPVYDDPSIEINKSTILVPDIQFIQEPIAVWGGPLLSVALTTDTGFLLTNPTAVLSSSNLQFFTWNIQEPEVPKDTTDPNNATKTGKEASTDTSSRYSGATKAKGDRPKLAPASSATTGIPCPSFAGTVTGAGVRWNTEGTRIAVCSPYNVHVVGIVSPRRLRTTTTADKSSSNRPSSSTPASTPATGTLVELARIPIMANSAEWQGNTLFVSTYDTKVYAIIPPILDPHLVADNVPSPMSRAGSRLQPIVIELQSHTLPPSLPSYLATDVFPASQRGLANCYGAVPLTVARNFLILAHYTGLRINPLSVNSTTPTAPPGITVSALSLTHPSLRSVMAATLAGASESRSSTVSYLQANVWAAQWGSFLPNGTSISTLATYLASIGAVPAALLLPGLTPSTGISIALSKRNELFTRMIKGFTTIDGPIIVAYLRRLIRTISDNDLLTLVSNYDYGTYGNEEEESNVVSVWVQVASFLSMVDTSIRTLLPDDGSTNEKNSTNNTTSIKDELLTLASRLTDLHAHRESLLIAATLHHHGSNRSGNLPNDLAKESKDENTNNNASNIPLLTSSEVIRELLLQAGVQGAMEAKVVNLGFV